MRKWKWHPCKKCGLIQVGPANDTFPYCEVCFHTVHKNYKSGIQVLKDSRGICRFPDHNYYGTFRLKEDGWREIERIQFSCVFMAVCNCGSMNRIPKIPEALTVEGRRKILYTMFPKFWVDKALSE